MTAPTQPGDLRGGMGASAYYAVAPCPECGGDRRMRHRRELCQACRTSPERAERRRARMARVRAARRGR